MGIKPDAAAATLLQQRTGLELMGIKPATAAATLFQQRTGYKTRRSSTNPVPTVDRIRTKPVAAAATLLQQRPELELMGIKPAVEQQ
jgi:hypothetical protein